MKQHHDAIELTPSIEDVGLVAAKETANLDLGEHLDREHDRAHKIEHIGEIHDRAVVAERLGRVSTDRNERAEGARAHYRLHQWLVDPLHVNGRVYCIRVELLQLTQQVVRVERGRRQRDYAHADTLAAATAVQTARVCVCVIVVIVIVQAVLRR